MDTPTILTYLGAIVGFGSIACSLAIKWKAANWRLTKVDAVTGAFAVAGFAVGIATIYVQNRAAEQAAAESKQRAADAEAERRRAEAQHQREVLSQTSLTSLTVEWSFDHVPARATAQPTVNAGTGCNADFEARRDPARRAQLYPFLTSLTGGVATDAPVLLLLRLDDAGADVLPLGMLPADPSSDEPLEWDRTKRDRLKDVSATIDLREDLDQCLDVTVHNLPAPAIQRSRRCDMKTDVRRDGDRVTVRWELGPVCISKGVDVANSFNVPKAALPASITALLLTSIGDFPFDPANVAAAGNSLPWTPRGSPRTGFQDHSHLTLVPNGRAGDAAVFDMRYYPTVRLGGVGGGAEVQHAFPLLTTFAGSRVASNGSG
jgi:hypothetical protein